MSRAHAPADSMGTAFRSRFAEDYDDSRNRSGTDRRRGLVLDATIVRTVLVPAAMALTGRATWWLPRRPTIGYPASASRPPTGPLTPSRCSLLCTGAAEATPPTTRSTPQRRQTQSIGKAPCEGGAAGMTGVAEQQATTSEE
ncbi:hypothetical protein [Streptomyces sp. 2A115]|uniref:hypothetical protein n=1 Tax=Streptomyces sp. 2A115 TaxID=3457439 RepID=UPI003FD55885